MIVKSLMVLFALLLIQINSQCQVDLVEIELKFVLNNAMKASEVLIQLGEPDEKSKEEYEPASGDVFQVWFYKLQGLEIIFVRDEKNIQLARSVKLYLPSELKTSKGIGIGSSKNDVKKAYKIEIKKTGKISTEEITIGDECYGIIFTFENDIVKSIFIGAYCE
jgi:hypothetical protein